MQAEGDVLAKPLHCQRACEGETGWFKQAVAQVTARVLSLLMKSVRNRLSCTNQIMGSKGMVRTQTINYRLNIVRVAHIEHRWYSSAVYFRCVCVISVHPLFGNLGFKV